MFSFYLNICFSLRLVFRPLRFARMRIVFAPSGGKNAAAWGKHIRADRSGAAPPNSLPAFVKAGRNF